MDQNLWDDMANAYDESVENNQDPIILGYLQREIEILSNLCSTISKSNKKCSIIDMGSGTGRVIFALDQRIQKDSIQFFGVEVSDPMLKHAKKKTSEQKRNSKISFLKYDLTDSNLFDYFKSDTVNIVMCLYNTLGVIPDEKRQKFVDNMIRIAGDDGLVIITAFNGDNFGAVAPRLYNPMLPMIRQIDENSFDEKNRVFHNNFGFRSQWFTKSELKTMLHSDVEPISIDIVAEEQETTIGNVFVNRKI